MRSRSKVLWSAALLTVACGLAAAPWLSSAGASPMMMLTVFTWTGNASANSDWDDISNWDEPVDYPSTTDDEAVFPGNAASLWSVDLTSETIGELTVEENVDFDCTAPGATLEVDKFVIDATSTYVSVSVCSGATIKTP